jgi:pimeloyl-ACP methyl ester carboxylesterase
MKANMVIMTARTDVLDRYADKMPPPPKNVTVLRPKDKPESHLVLADSFRKHAAGAAPAPAATAPMPGRIWAEYFQVDGGSLYARRNTDGKGRPIVFVHASAASSFSMDRFMQPFIGKRPVLAVDLPGNGESDNPMGPELTVAAQAKYLAQAIRAAGYTEIDCFGHWGGAAVAIELAAQNKSLVKNLAIPNVMMPEGEYLAELLANYTPEFTPEWAGTHLVKAWHMVRDQELFAPWFKRDKAHAIKNVDTFQLAPEVIHRRTVDLFKMGDLYRAAYAAHFKYPAAQRLADTTCRVLFGAADDTVTKKGLAAVGARGVSGMALAEFFAA